VFAWQNTTSQEEERLAIDHPDFYRQGVSDVWKLVGPSHMQRYLSYDGENATENSVSESQSAGELLYHLRTKVLESQPFRRFLRAITSLGEPTGHRGKIRRFRPGRDYTVAHHGLLREKSVLDATLCFVAGTGTVVPDDDVDNQINDEEPDEADVAWQSGDCGGFECYIAADLDDDNAKRASSGPADEYNEDDDTELLSVSASNNTLSLVYRDPGTMRFVKYVSHRAPSSRWDIAMEYQVEDDSENGGEEEEGGEEGSQ